MPLVIRIITYLLFVIPALIVKEGYKMFKKHMNEKNLWWEIPSFLIIILCIVFIWLWVSGYR